MKRMIFLYFCLTAFHAVGQNFLANGSFEYGLNYGWNYTLTNNSQAIFTLDKSAKVMDGDVALKVEVSSISQTNTNSVKATTYFTAENDSIYLLRFWARGGEESRIFVEVEGSETSGVLYELHTGKTMYYLPFKFDTKKQDKDMAINFYFKDYQTKQKINDNTGCKINTIKGAIYYLDGVEVLDSNNKQHIDVIHYYNWDHNQASGLGWVAGDNDVSLRLPDGRTIWFFNDSFYATNHPDQNRLNDWGTFIRNACVVEESDGTLVTRPVTNQGGQTVYFQIPNDQLIWKNGGVTNFFWIGDVIMEDGKVKVHLIECNEASGGVENTQISYLALFSYPELKYLGLERQQDFCPGFETFFVDDEDNKIYLYRTEDVDTWTRYTHVARADVGDLNGAKGSWEFWDGTEWSPNRVDGDKPAGRVNSMIADAVTKLGKGNYAQISMPVVSHDVQVSFAPSPQGPWTTPQTIYSATEDSASWYYMPNIHGQLPNGNYSISFSANFQYCLFFCRDCDTWAFVDKYWYRPRYIQVDLLALSPYSEKKDCAGVVNGEAYLDDCGVCAGGTTGIEPCIPETIQYHGISGISGVYTIQNKQSGLYMTTENQRLGNHALVVQSAYNGSKLQQFKLVELSDGYYNIINEGSGLMINPVNLSEDAKANIEQWNGLNYSDITDFAGGSVSCQYEADQTTNDINNIVDNNVMTKYSISHGHAWIQFHSADPQVVISYGLAPANSALQDPKNWALYGSNDGENWVKLDTVSNFKFPSRYKEEDFDIVNETPYSYYRMYMDCFSGNALQLAEWKLMIGTTCEGVVDAQKFIIQDAGNGYVKFYNKLTDMAMEVLDGFNYDGANVWQIPDVGQYGTLWKLIDQPLAIKNLETAGKPEMIIYPNPVKQQINIKLPAEWQGSDFFIIYINGSLVYSSKISNEPFDVGRLSAGYYLIKVRKDDDVLISRFLKY